MLNENRSLVFEGMVSVRAVIESGSRPIKKLFYDEARIRSHQGELAWLRHRAKESGFEIIICGPGELAELTSGNSHGGVCALCGERALPEIGSQYIKPDGFYLMLEGIEDPYNFGFSVRSAYAAGVDGIILPERNWMDSAGVVCRSSAGASERMPMYTANDPVFVSLFRTAGYKIAAAEIKESVDMWKADLGAPLLLIIGGEKRGISGALLDQCDLRVRISYGRDFNESLPSAAATAILCFEAARRKTGKNRR